MMSVPDLFTREDAGVAKLVGGADPVQCPLDVDNILLPSAMDARYGFLDIFGNSAETIQFKSCAQPQVELA